MFRRRKEDAAGASAPFATGNESGAIIVGAGYPPVAFGGTDVDRARLGFSCYGSRVNLQGWGRQVMTTGYGSNYSAEGVDYYYTRTFSGTSSASPIVTAAVVIAESYYRTLSGGSNLDSSLMINILTATGSPQQSGVNPASQHIGPRPDLEAALFEIELLFDMDGDSVTDLFDNCPADYNPDQLSDDGDDFGNVCELCPGVATDSNIVLSSGDADNSGELTSADIIFLVNYVLKGGPAPLPCAAVGDTNCDGLVTSADILGLILFTFQGGPVPCEVCTGPPGNWDCR